MVIKTKYQLKNCNMAIGEQNINIHKALSFDYDAVEKLYE